MVGLYKGPKEKYAQDAQEPPPLYFFCALVQQNPYSSVNMSYTRII